MENLKGVLLEVPLYLQLSVGSSYLVTPLRPVYVFSSLEEFLIPLTDRWTELFSLFQQDDLWTDDTLKPGSWRTTILFWYGFCPNPSSRKKQSADIFVSLTVQEVGVKTGEGVVGAHLYSRASARQEWKRPMVLSSFAKG